MKSLPFSYLTCGVCIALFATTGWLLPRNGLAQSTGKDAMQLSAEPEGMKSIFNGVDLSGWKGDDRLWTVRDGVIRGETTPEKKCNKNTFLIWQGGETTDFDLRLSFRVSTVNNSGVQYRSRHITDPSEKPGNDFVLRGYQHEIRNSGVLPDVPGFIYDEGGKRGRICLAGEKSVYKNGQKVVEKQLLTAEEFKSLFKVDQWNDIAIIAKGNHIRHYLNGRLILEFSDSPDHALSTGMLGLQLHHGKPMWAEFKNIRIKEL